MYVRVVATNRLALGADPLQPTYLIDLSKETAVPFDGGEFVKIPDHAGGSSRAAPRAPTPEAGDSDPCGVAARTRQARREPGLDRLNSYPNDRYYAGGRANLGRDEVGNGNNRVRVPVDDLASESGKAFGAALAGIPLNGEVFPSISPSRRSSSKNDW
jgi:hypothetical protein